MSGSAANRPAPVGARLWLVRHAQPLVALGTCYGSSDVQADAQATGNAAQRLAKALPAQARLFYSTLQRCEQMAFGIKALRPDLASQPDANLREMDFGIWEGRAWADIGKPAIDTWTAAFATHAPGGGESLNAMLTRVQSALHAAQRLCAAQAVHDVVWITHAGVARCVDWLQANGAGVAPRPDQWPLAAPAWGEWEVRSLNGESINS